MSETTETPLDLVRADLRSRFVGLPWASRELRAAFNAYLIQLGKQLGIRVSLAVLFPSSSVYVPLDEPAVRLGAIQKLGVVERQELLQTAWAEANKAAVPKTPYKDWLTDVLLETLHRLRRRVEG